MWIKRLFSKRKNYVMFFMGGTPDKILDLFEKIVDNKTSLTAIFSPEFVSIRFDSIKSIKELKLLMTEYCGDSIYGYFLFSADDEFYHKIRVKSIGVDIYRQYVMGDSVLPFIQQLSEFYDMIRDTKEQIFTQLKSLVDPSENFTLPSNTQSEITEEDINDILEKIKLSGIESLTDTQKEILEKYSK